MGCVMVLTGSARGNQTGVQSQKAVTAYFSSKQLLTFGLARNPGVLPPSSGSGVPPSARVNNSRAGHSPPAPPPRAGIPQTLCPFPITAIYDSTRIITPLSLTRWKKWKLKPIFLHDNFTIFTKPRIYIVACIECKTNPIALCDMFNCCCVNRILANVLI